MLSKKESKRNLIYIDFVMKQDFWQHGSIPINLILSSSLLGQRFLWLFRHPSLSGITFVRSLRLHLVFAQGCLVNTGVSTCKKFIGEFVLLLQCLARLVRLTYMVCEMGDKGSYSCWFVGYWFHELFKTACSILVLVLIQFFSPSVSLMSKWFNHIYLEEIPFYFT